MKKNTYDSGQAFKNGDAASGNALLNTAIEAEGQMNDTAFEQRVADEAKAKWTGVKYWCTKCNFKGEIDVFTEKGVVKECKSSGRADKDQLTRHLIAAPVIFGAVTGFHLAVPSAKIRSAQDSLGDRGLDKSVDIQPH